MSVKKILLVEGNDDRHVIWALCQQYNISETFEVKDCKGIDPLLELIPIYFKDAEIDTIGIIIDADTNADVRWKSLKGILKQANFDVDSLPSTGLFVSNGIQKVGIWMMPNNNTHGMLEDFISFLVPDDDKLLPIVEATLKNIESQQLNKYSSMHQSKAKIHTWLAWQEVPGTPMGQSITKKYLDTSQKTCTVFIHWLRELFE